MTEQNEVPAVSVPLTALADVVQIIDLATTRGAWRGGEIGQIGRVRDAFAEVVEAHHPDDVATPPAEETEDAEVVASE